MNNSRFVVVGCKPWNRRVFVESLRTLPGVWTYLDQPEGLTPEALATLQPRYVFFLHWSWKVPAEIYTRFECVCFHMTDVPFGRGGSPLQNLIQRGLRETRLTALRMVEEMDAGPVYFREPLSLEGGAEEILIRSSELAAEMIARLVREQPEPVTQVGEVVRFQRRRPEESRLPEEGGLGPLHDFIRMLDADGYPAAFLDHGEFRLEFRRSTRYEGRLEADVRITRRETPASGSTS